MGRTLIAAGVLVLLFVGYQIWGTGLHTAQAQDDLERRFDAQLAEAASATSATTPTTPTTATTATTVEPPVTTTSRLPVTTAPPLPRELLPARGGPAGRIRIDRIGLDYLFVEGVSVENLKDGPGHYPRSPLPGQAGNAAIAGHRTTYGAPFADLDQLRPGDEVGITTVQGHFTYEVRETQIVRASAIEVLEPDHWGFPNALTLTACHPRFSARQRIVVGAELVGEPVAPPPAPPTTVVHDPGGGVVDGSDETGDTTVPGDAGPGADDELGESGLSGDDAGRGPVVAWAALCAAIWLGAWAVGRRWGRLRWPAYAAGLVPFLAALFFFFEEFSRLLPANY
jgi:sortase A